jgi:hypothetical protein
LNSNNRNRPIKKAVALPRSYISVVLPAVRRADRRTQDEKGGKKIEESSFSKNRTRTKKKRQIRSRLGLDSLQEHPTQTEAD